MASPLANLYRCIDDSGSSNGPLGSTFVGGATSYAPVCPDVSAPNITAAYQFAYILSTLLQRPVRLVPLASPPPYTLVVGIGPNIALTSVPSGITF